MNKAIQVKSYKTLERAALTLIKDVTKKRKADGRDPFCVPVMRRTTKDGKPDIRFLNFAYKDLIDGERISEDGRGYPGALGQAEECFSGIWRLASYEEEDAEYLRQKRQQVDAAVLNIQTHSMVSQATAASSEAYRKSVNVLREANLQNVSETGSVVDSEKESMKAQLAEMKAQIAQLIALKAPEDKPKRGRPAKTQETPVEEVPA